MALEFNKKYFLAVESISYLMKQKFLGYHYSVIYKKLHKHSHRGTQETLTVTQETCIGNHKATCGAQSHFSGETKNLFTARDLTVGRFSINTKCAYSNLENFGKIILALFSINIKRYIRFWAWEVPDMGGKVQGRQIHYLRRDLSSIPLFLPLYKVCSICHICFSFLKASAKSLILSPFWSQ